MNFTSLSKAMLLVLSASALSACGGSKSKSPAPDTTAPVITLTGAAAITLEATTPYNELGATATDDTDGDIIVSPEGEVNVNTVGTYTVTYNATDAAGNAAAPVTRTVNVADTTMPVISLTGEANVDVNFGETYLDAGATATDLLDGEITATATGEVDVNTVGTYTVTYNATDAAGNAATAVTRTINVVDVTAPVITLTGDAVVELNYGDVYVDDGANATDDVDATVTVTNDSDAAVIVDVVNSYTVTYTATDAAGNVGIATRTVDVVDNEAPVITLNGEQSIRHIQGREYTDLGAMANDNVDGALTVSEPTSNVDTSTVGEYTLTYSVTDNAGNNAELTRTVVVAEQRPFIMTWETTTTDENITIGALTDDVNDGPRPEESFTYNYTIDWGDGTVETNQTGDASHNYAQPGVHTVKITGTYPGIYQTADFLDPMKLSFLTVEQWGDIQWQTFFRAFYGATRVTSNALDHPNTSQVVSMAIAFEGARAFNHDMTQWDMSNVTNMQFMFSYHESFNQDISAWDISKVEDVTSMFDNAAAFDQDISNWDFSALEPGGLDFFLAYSGMSVANYDQFLIAVAAIAVYENENIKSYDMFYSTAAQAAHDKLEALGWRMRDQLYVAP